MLSAKLFQAIGDLVVTAKARRARENEAFLQFFRGLVEALPADAVNAFGTMNGVVTVKDGIAHNFGIELTATDYIWWKQQFAQGAQFKQPAAYVQLDMLNRLSKAAESERLTADERKALLSLLDPDTAA